MKHWNISTYLHPLCFTIIHCTVLHYVMLCYYVRTLGLAKLPPRVCCSGVAGGRRRAVAAVDPRIGQRQKLLLHQQFILHHNHILLSTISVLQPTICRKCMCGRDFASDPRGSSRCSSDSLVGRGGDTPSQTPPHSAQAPRPSRSGLPLHIISGYATGLMASFLLEYKSTYTLTAAAVPAEFG